MRRQIGGEITEDERERGQQSIISGTLARKAKVPAAPRSLAALATRAEASAVKTPAFSHVNRCRATPAHLMLTGL